MFIIYNENEIYYIFLIAINFKKEETCSSNMSNIDSSVMEQYKKAEEVHFHQRRFVYPEFDSIIVGDRTAPKNIPLRFLIQELEISPEKLKDVYEFDSFDKTFTGRFRSEGKQELANILGKRINFWNRPSSEPVTYGEPEVYSPK